MGKTIFAAVMVLNFLLGKSAASSQPSATSIVAMLKNGEGVELLGVVHRSNGSLQWWQANSAAPMKPPKGVKIEPQDFQDGQFRFRSCGFAFRLASGTARDPSPSIRAIDEWKNVHASPESLSIVDSNHPDGPMLFGVNFDMERTTLVHFDLASGPWTTLFEVPAEQLQAQLPKTIGKFHILAFGQTPRDFRVTIDCPHLDPAGDYFPPVPYAQRVIAATRDGAVIVAQVKGFGGSTFPQSHEYIYGFPREQLGNLKVIAVQTRPWNGWVEFRNISLYPGVTTAVQIITSDDVPATRPTAFH